MPYCQKCKKRYDTWVNLEDNVYNPNVLSHQNFHICISCFMLKEHIKDLEERIDVLKFKIIDCRKDMKNYKSNLSLLQQELNDLNWNEWSNN